MNEPIIITKLCGGLGNQMFQYAAGRALSLLHSCELKLDISEYDRYSMHNGYELGRYEIVAEIARNEEIYELSGMQNRMARFLRRKLGFGRKTHFTEQSYGYMPEFISICPPVYIDGYWQSYRYFETVAETIRKELTLAHEPTGLNKELADNIGETHSVSIHIRRGDYINNPVAQRMHGFVGIQYYQAAINQVKKQLESPHFFIFSDDIVWAKENLTFSDPVTFVDHNSGATSFEDMRLMSYCSQHLIANSSFSWWAAWLNPSDNKIVYFPENWFVSSSNNVSSLCPPDWVSIAS